MYALLIALKPKSGETWPWVADFKRPNDLVDLHYEGRFILQIEPLEKTYDLRAYGQMLGEALFQGDLRDALTNALAQARQEGWLRVMLYIDQDAKELRSLHWERILAPIDGRWEFLALNQSTPFSLYLTSRSDRRYPPLPGNRMSMLLTIANPQNLEEYELTPFDTAGTLDSLTQALGEMPPPQLFPMVITSALAVDSGFIPDQPDDPGAFSVAFLIRDDTLGMKDQTRLFRFSDPEMHLSVSGAYPAECLDADAYASVAEQLTCLFPSGMEVILVNGAEDVANQISIAPVTGGYEARLSANLEVY